MTCYVSLKRDITVDTPNGNQTVILTGVVGKNGSFHPYSYRLFSDEQKGEDIAKQWRSAGWTTQVVSASS